MKYFTKTTTFLTMLLFTFGLFAGKDIVYASEQDPGAGRLSGNSIASDFYDTETDSDENLNIYYNQYGSRTVKSPYTKTKYTHQTQFDDRKILHGIDISKWQGEINWAKVKADGIDYAFIQVGFRGYGSSGILNDTTRDPYFDINMQNAIANGIKVGVYVFSQATTEAEAIEEATYILDAIGNYPISMPLVMDYEYASTEYGLGGRLYKAKLSKSKATKVCMAFCKEIAAAGYTPMIYANKSMLEDQLNATTLTKAGYRIWLANYTNKTTYGGIFDFWQYSEKGSVSGISGDVDMNFYYAQDGDNFAPAPNSISSSIFTEVTDQTYTGRAITPAMVVTNNGITLTPGVDYTITYSDNTNIGTATITITGIGNYCDVRKIRFDILPKAPAAPIAKKKASNYITLSWKKDAAVTGYEIHRATAVNGSYQLVKTITKKKTTSYKNTKLTAGKCYYYKLRSYKKIGNQTYYSEFSPIKTIYTKTGYTKNATPKLQLAIYDAIPGTKTEIIEVPEETTEENTEDSTEDNTSTDSTETSTEESTTTNSTETSTEESTATDSTETSTEESTTTDSTEVSTEENNATNSTDIPTKLVKVPVDSTALVTVSKKATLKVMYSTTYKKKTWYYVSYKKNGTTYKGFVQGKNVTVTKLGKVVKTKKVNVRKKATVYSKKLTTLKKNTKVTILSTKKKYGVTWYRVQFKKNKKTYKGWISAPYIKII